MYIKPPKLNKGDTIGIISPAGALKDVQLLYKVTNYFESKGYKVKISPHAEDKNGYLAGEDNDRLSDLKDFFLNSEIKAILCTRGGYGTFRILDKINFNLLRENPKIFVGYSDITALLNNLVEKANLVVFHGPLALSDFGVDEIDEYTERIFWEILENRAEIPYSFPNAVPYHCINPGKAEGVLIGGNLSIICGLAGTSFFPDFHGKLLLLEDTGESLYKIDRMLTQLKLAGVFEKISGLIFGEFTSVVQSSSDDINRLSTLDVIADILKDLKIPIGYGFSAGHGIHKATLPMGVKYFFDSKDFQLTLLEEYLKDPKSKF